MQLNTYKEIIEDFRQGKMVILLDDEDRENEGDILMAASLVEPKDINFMATHARGLICLTLTEERCRQLNLPLMVHNNGSQHSTNFTVSIEAASGISTGISAADRAHTVQTAVATTAKPQDIVQPGHIFPVMAQAGGVLSRAGHTEAGCDLARLAGLEPAAVIVEVMNEDGSMARRPELEEFAKRHNIKIGTIAGLIQYRIATDRTIECIKQRQINTVHGKFELRTYLNNTTNEHHFALIKGDVCTDEPVLVRVHVSSTAKDVLGIYSEETSNSWDFRAAMQHIADVGNGVLVYICHTETTEDIENSIDELVLGKKRRPRTDIGYKQVGAGSQILRDLGVKKLRLLSAPLKFNALSGFDLEVVEYISFDNSNN